MNLPAHGDEITDEATQAEIRALFSAPVARAPGEAASILDLISGVFGASIPLILRKVGSDPASSSSIVLTTITDVAMLAVFLGLATCLI